MSALWCQPHTRLAIAFYVMVIYGLLCSTISIATDFELRNGEQLNLKFIVYFMNVFVKNCTKILFLLHEYEQSC